MWELVWIILIIVVVLIVFKFKEVRHKFGIIVIALVLIFLVFSFTQVYKTHDVDLKSVDGITQVAKLYFSWLGTVFNNLGHVTTYAIHQEWGLNDTNSTK